MHWCISSILVAYQKMTVRCCFIYRRSQISIDDSNPCRNMSIQRSDEYPSQLSVRATVLNLTKRFELKWSRAWFRLASDQFCFEYPLREIRVIRVIRVINKCRHVRRYRSFEKKKLMTTAQDEGFFSGSTIKNSNPAVVFNWVIIYFRVPIPS